MRHIVASKEFSLSKKTMHIQLNDRRLVFNAYRDLKERTMLDHNCSEKEIFRWCDDTACRNLTWGILENKYKDVLPVTERCYAFLGLEIGINELSTSSFESRIERCMSIPYVRESATGLAVEAFIKRLESIHILEIFERPIYTKDTSVLRIFTDEALASVQLMNNEWLAHNDNPEYDHGAPMFWFADLDNELEFELRRIEPILNKIANQWIPTENRKKARQVLYDWREYLSGDYAGY